jgi:hypothetical protein
MKWPWLFPTSQDVLTVMVVIVMIAVGYGLFSFALKYPNPDVIRSNYGFGPNWRCTVVPGGEPVCVKKLPQDG